ncbi:MAG: hypothetical protein ACLR13_04960 [Acutalibacteraceae bacterium]
MGLDVFFGGGDSNLLSRNEAWVLILFLYFVFMLVTSALSARKSERLLIWQMTRSLRKRPKEAAALKKHSACGSWSAGIIEEGSWLSILQGKSRFPWNQ